MRSVMGTLAVALTLSASVALAQTAKPDVSGAPSARNSGAGIVGQTGNKNGPAAKSGDTVGSSSNANQQNQLCSSRTRRTSRVCRETRAAQPPSNRIASDPQPQGLPREVVRVGGDAATA